MLNLIFVKAKAQDIVINELIYSNKTVITDSDGDTPDYIELYNRGNETVNLLGYKLTDDKDDIDDFGIEANYDSLWALPDVNLAPGQFLLVFASGKDRHTPSDLHTDFRLSLMKDSLFLVNPDYQIIDQVDARCVPSDKSFGRKPDGSDFKTVMAPSPGKSNNLSEAFTINFQTDSLAANYKSGFYAEPISLNFSKLHAQNTIRYTLDGDIPDEESPVMDGTPIELKDITSNKNRFANKVKEFEPGNKIFKANIVRAVVYSNGCPASNEISNVYFISKNIVNKYNNVPVVSLITEKDNLFDDDIGIYVYGNNNNYSQRGKSWERLTHIEIFDKDKNLIIEQDGGIRISGKGSRAGAQKPLRLYAREKYGEEYFEYPFFEQKPELTQFKTLLLRSIRGLSGSLIKDEVTQVVVQDMKFDYSGAQSVAVFLNGEYWGIYSLRERFDEGYIENNFNIKDAEADIISHNLQDISLEEGTLDNYTKLTDFIENADPSSEDFFNEVSEYIDIPGIIDYYIAEMYFANYDFPHNNIKIWRLTDEGAKWRFYFFDCDACMINLKYDLLSEYSNDVDLLQKHEDWCTFIFRKLIQNNQFRHQFSSAFYYHLQNTFNPQKVISVIDELEKLYEPLVGEHTYRWNQPRDFTKWKNNVEMLKIFAMQRPVFQSEQLIENFGNPYRIYPNPSNGLITILRNIDYRENLNVQILSVSGEIIYTYKLSKDQNDLSIDLPLEKGIYIVKTSSSMYNHSTKLIIQ